MDDLFVRAAATNLVSCDELVPSEHFHQSLQESRSVFWERSHTNKVVHIPCGAHPSSCNPIYGIDVAHFKEYAAGAKQEQGWQDYYDKYIALSEADYLQKVGGIDSIKALALPIY